MNRTFRIVWNESLRLWQSVSELCRSKQPARSTAAKAVTGSTSDSSRRPAGFLLTALASALLFPMTVQASNLPTGGTVVAGSGSISQNGTTLTIHQHSDKLAADWASFSIGAGHTANFVQPGADSVALNRVLGADVSVIQGALNANGHVFLLNPNGVLFTDSAQVNVGGLVASTLHLSTDDFLAGNYRFEGASANAIINQGNIVATNGGTVALIAARIENTGSISATGGNVLLGAGSRVLLDMGGPVKLEVEQGAIDALIAQGGAIQADGGLVYLTAKAAGDLASTVINHTGITQARTLATGENGEIYLMGGFDNGERIEVAGVLDASAPDGGDGGFVETSAADVRLADDLVVTTYAPYGETGLWLIDPTNILIEQNACTGTGCLSATAIQTGLAGSNVTITTVVAGAEPGHITVGAPISWTSNFNLTLSAHGSIYINEDITATGASARLTLRYGQSSSNGGSNDYFLNEGSKIFLSAGTSSTTVSSWEQNFATKKGTSGGDLLYRVLTTQAQLQALDSTSDSVKKGQRYALGADIDMTGTFTPIGSNSSRIFEDSSFHGLGHTITDMVISRAGTDYNGLFGYIKKSLVRDINLTDATITGRDYTGGIIGYAEDLDTHNAVFRIFVEGLTLNGRNNVGGLIGYIKGSSSDTQIISQSFSDGSVTGSGSYIGGLLGYIEQGNVVDAYSVASVTGGSHVGGLIGYAKGTYVVRNTYAAGAVTGSSNTGGLIGTSDGTRFIYDSYWDTQTTSQNSSANNNGSQSALNGNNGREAPKNTTEMMQQTTFNDWNFVDPWIIDEGTSYPYFRWAKPSLAFIEVFITADNQSFTYNGNFFSGTWTFTSSDPLGHTGSPIFAGDALTATNAGGYTINISGLTANSGYTLTYQSGTLTIDQALLTITADNQSKTYGDLFSFTGSEFSSSGLVGVETIGSVTLSSGAEAQFANVAGSPYTINISNATGGTFNPLNYDITYQPGSFTINQASLTIGGLTAQNKVYDTTTDAVITGTAALNGVLGSDVVNLDGTVTSGSFDDKNVGTGKLVTADLSPLSLSGTDAGNYDITGVLAALSANITPASLTVDGLSAQNKVYDATTTATIVGTPTLNGVLGADVVNVSGTGAGTFVTANVGTDIDVTPTVGSLALSGTDSGNYLITGVNGPMAADITPATLTITAIDDSKEYDGQPYTGGAGVLFSGFVGGEDEGVLGGALSYTGSSQGAINVGNYDITPQGFTSGNYDIIYADGLLIIGKREILLTITADDLSRIYGEPNPALTWQVTGGSLVQGDQLTGSLATTATISSPIGNYAITQGTLDNANYDISFVNGTLTITPRPVIITADDKNKTYGDADPALTHSAEAQSTGRGLMPGDSFTGALERDAGEDVGAYTIRQGTLANANYDISFQNGTLTIGQFGIVLALMADDLDKVYGDADPDLTWQIISGALLGNDTLTGSLARDAGENVGDYAIRQGTLGNANYDITFTNGVLTITPRQLTVTPDDGATKVYGETDPAFGWQITEGSLLGNDVLTGALGRDLGEDVGQYEINQGTLGNPNYSIHVPEGYVLAITPRGIELVADDQSKIYGETDPALTWQITGGSLLAGDELTGSLSRDSGEDAGSYAINQGTLGNSNYEIAFTGGTLTITQREITITLPDGQIVKVYGEDDPDIPWQIVDGNLLDGDSLDGSLGRDDGENVGEYDINLGTLGNPNYQINLPDGLVLLITPRGITVTADNKNKVYGNADPALTWAVTDGSLVGSDTLSGSLSRAAGNNVGNYVITQSSLANNNYDITFVNGTLSITARPITVTADDQQKSEGTPDPVLTWQVTDGNLVGSDNLNGALTRDAGEVPGDYTIRQGSLDNSNYAIAFVEGTLSIDIAFATDEGIAGARGHAQDVDKDTDNDESNQYGTFLEYETVDENESTEARPGRSRTSRLFLIQGGINYGQ
jgi:filamentous hemagglutinin family protein